MKKYFLVSYQTDNGIIGHINLVTKRETPNISVDFTKAISEKLNISQGKVVITSVFRIQPDKD
jgi:hypothetical protein